MKHAGRKKLLQKIDSRRRRFASHLPTHGDPLPVTEGAYTISYSPNLILGQPLLTRRELEILWHVARGDTDRGIAEKLFLSRRTVSSHVSSVLAKLDVPSRRDAVATAARLGLLTRRQQAGANSS